MLKSQNIAARNCGLIYSRYYDEYDLSKELQKLFPKLTFSEFTSYLITYTSLTGRIIPQDLKEPLDWTPVKAECPEKGNEFINNFKKLSYSQQMRCPRKYIGRDLFLPYTQIESIEYAYKPTGVDLKDLARHIKNNSIKKSK